MVRRPWARSSRCSVGAPPGAAAARRGRPRRGFVEFSYASLMLPETVREAASRFGDRTAYVDDDGRPCTYADIDRRSDELAAGLAGHGIAPGAVLALVLP